MCVKILKFKKDFKIKLQKRPRNTCVCICVCNIQPKIRIKVAKIEQQQGGENIEAQIVISNNAALAPKQEKLGRRK